MMAAPIGKTTPINPLVSTPRPMDAADTAAHKRGRVSRSSSARANPHSDRVIQNVSRMSGIRKRVNRNMPTQVDNASPEKKPARSENAQLPMRNVSQQRAMAASAIGSRAAQSCTPNALYERPISQYFSGAF